MVEELLSGRGYSLNYCFYKTIGSKQYLFINATCKLGHPPKDKRWNTFEQGHGCQKCYDLTKIVYKDETCRKISRALRDRFSKAFKNGATKQSSAVRDLGISIEEFKTYIESLFKPGMTWGNHGYRGWHIDHIRPLVDFDLKDREEQKKAVHYTNLQPLWWWENFKKGPRQGDRWQEAA